MLIIILFIMALVSLIVSIATIIYLFDAVKREHEHVRRLKNAISSLKENMDAKIERAVGRIDANVDAIATDHSQWQASFKRAADEKIAGLCAKYEAYVKSIDSSLLGIAKSREIMAVGLRELVRAIHAIIKEEKAAGVPPPESETKT